MCFTRKIKMLKSRPAMPGGFFMAGAPLPARPWDWLLFSPGDVLY